MKNSKEKQDMREIYLGVKAVSHAENVSNLFSNALKRKQVRKNILAVYAGIKHLNQIGIPSDFENSNSYNPLIHTVSNVSDLVVPGGRLLFCIVAPDENSIAIPETEEDDCIGYIAVQFAEDLTKVLLLGFVPISSLDYCGADFTLDALQPLSCLEKILLQQMYPQSGGRESEGSRRPVDIAAAVNDIRKLAEVVVTPHPREWLQPVVNSIASSAVLGVASSLNKEEDSNEEALIPDDLLKYTTNIQLDDSYIAVTITAQKRNDGKCEFWVTLNPQDEDDEITVELPKGLRIRIMQNSNDIYFDETIEEPEDFIETDEFLWPINKEFRVEIEFANQKHIIQCPRLKIDEQAS